MKNVIHFEALVPFENEHSVYYFTKLCIILFFMDIQI